MMTGAIQSNVPFAGNFLANALMMSHTLESWKTMNKLRDAAPCTAANGHKWITKCIRCLRFIDASKPSLSPEMEPPDFAKWCREFFDKYPSIRNDYYLPDVLKEFWVDHIEGKGM
jgi:hypothetical protein